MKARSSAAALAVVALAVMVVGAGPVVAAEPCPSLLSSANNPAFGAPRPCPAATPKSVSPSAAAKGRTDTTVTTEDGKTVLRQGDTTVRISGSVTGQMGFGNAAPK